ncbi:hypothetical protein CLIB1444_03S08108 [[Candida] jaroonii]|uniref:Uncharacterized protein n=1 Tax=[Candida] jaroonii TaxID=467808 RepID=A0ACA9Y6C1_9ASCO|nr:hypothetical protein CLIB1444_03S08108 [[Candida] jaroonii]
MDIIFQLPPELQVEIIDHLDFATLHQLMRTNLQHIAVESFHRVYKRPEFSSGREITIYKATTGNRAAVTLMLELVKTDLDLSFELVFKPHDTPEGQLVTVRFTEPLEIRQFDQWMEKHNLRMEFNIEINMESYRYEPFAKYVLYGAPIVQRYAILNDNIYKETIICKLVRFPYPLNPGHCEIQYIKILKKLKLDDMDQGIWEWAVISNEDRRHNLARTFDLANAIETDEMVYCNISSRMRRIKLIEPVAEQWRILDIDDSCKETWLTKDGEFIPTVTYHHF